MKTFTDLEFVEQRPSDRSTSQTYSWEFDKAILRFDNGYGVIVRDQKPNPHQYIPQLLSPQGYEITVIKYDGEDYVPDFSIPPYDTVGQQTEEQITQLMKEIQSL
jgi:hypothetical protein